jgi:hypothetical protein
MNLNPAVKGQPSGKQKPPSRLETAAMQPPVERKLLTRHEAAALLGGIHIRSVDRLLRRGKLVRVRLGRRSLVTVQSAEALAAK